MIYVAWALVILMGSMFVGLGIAAWMHSQDDDGTYGAEEGRWPE
jgi:hypothetical protein